MANTEWERERIEAVARAIEPDLYEGGPNPMNLRAFTHARKRAQAALEAVDAFDKACEPPPMREVGRTKRQLLMMAAQFRAWVDFDVRSRKSEGLESSPETKLIRPAPPMEWPSHEVLLNWANLMHEASEAIPLRAGDIKEEVGFGLGTAPPSMPDALPQDQLRELITHVAKKRGEAPKSDALRDIETALLELWNVRARLAEGSTNGKN